MLLSELVTLIHKVPQGARVSITSTSDPSHNRGQLYGVVEFETAKRNFFPHVKLFHSERELRKILENAR